MQLLLNTVQIMNFDPNDWYNTRRLDYIPQHFVTVDLLYYCNESTTESWILENCTGRYAFGKVISENLGHVISVRSVVAFENTSDATHFLLIKDSIFNVNDFDF